MARPKHHPAHHPAHQRERWTQLDEQLLRDCYATVPTANLARTLGRPAHKVQAKAIRMGLRKTHECKAQMARMAILQPDHPGRRTQFSKGLRPWNTGTKGLAGQHEGCRQTQFKPGDKPHTTMPVGAYRLDPDGYLQVKYSETPGSPTRRWMGVHRWVWEQAHGPTPEGHVVVFKPGRFTTVLEQITLDAVELITRRELMARNSIHQMPPELADVSRLRGTLTRAINQRQREDTP